MKTIPINLQQPAPPALGEAIAALRASGLVCLPCNGSYRLLADLADATAVNKLFQSKGRTAKAPALVFVADRAMLDRVVAAVDPVSERLIAHFWPGTLTLLLPPHPDLPPRVIRDLVRLHGKLGVRVPQAGLLRDVVAGLGRPVLVSSANKQRKLGAGSPAQVRKNFSMLVDVFLDAGDLAPQAPSTVVEVCDERCEIRRAGQLAEQQIRAAAAG